MDKGKGYALCETLLKTARRLHPKAEYRPLEPILTWKEIFSIPGIAEPPWTDLEPLQHEALFLRLHELYEMNSSLSYFGNLTRVDLFFARHRYVPPLCPQKGGCTVPSDLRRATTLEGYRDFVKAGGRVRTYPLDIGSEEHPFPAALIQYEYPSPPAWHRTGWYGLTFYAKLDLSDRIVNDSTNLVHTGTYRRLVLFRGQPVILNINTIPYLLAEAASGPASKCTIIRSELQSHD
jgi:hypothetical protein